MDWGFKKIPFTLYTYVLAKILQNGAKFMQKEKLTPGFRNHRRNLINFRQSSGKSKKLNLDGLLSKKYLPSAKTSYTEDLSNIIFNYLCKKSPNY